MIQCIVPHSTACLQPGGAATLLLTLKEGQDKLAAVMLHIMYLCQSSVADQGVCQNPEAGQCCSRCCATIDMSVLETG